MILSLLALPPVLPGLNHVTVGLAPVSLAISIGELGSEIQTSTGIVGLAGLITSSILNMLVLPAI
jgi:Cu/Ag efflux pump CusA